MIKSIILKVIDMIKRYGIYSTILIIYYKLMQNKRNKGAMLALKITDDELEKQRSTKFASKLLFSIVTPVYNTDINHLKEMLNSCINQTYSDWEIILADGSSIMQPGDVCKEYALHDSRIKYHKLQNNLGISANTNEAIKYATGEYILLLDHDDILHPSALYECMSVIEKTSADFIYSDMVSFIGHINRLFHFYHKPAFAIYTLRSLNYICHLAVYKKSLADKVGAFQSKYDSAQDYDMFLRLIEATSSIVHIPKILYYWRAHNNSMSFNINSKPETLTSAINVISDHYKRLGIDATVSNSSIATTFKTIFNYKTKPKVAIILTVIKNQNIEYLLKHIISKTNYENYEIIIASSLHINVKEHPIRIKVVKLDTNNTPQLINAAVKETDASQLLIMCQSISITDKEYMTNMLNYSERDDVGVVMVKILDNVQTIYSAGIGVDKKQGVRSYHEGTKKRFLQFIRILTYAHNISAVSQRFYMISRTLFDKYNGLDERYHQNLHAVDLSLKLLADGYNNILTPYSTVNFTARDMQNENDLAIFKKTWANEIEQGDPYYNVLTD